MSTNVTVKWDDRKLRAKLARARDGAAAVVADRLRRVRDEVLADARSDWPVDSGQSKDSLQPDEEVGADHVRVGIGSGLDYVPYIKGDPWTELVEQPLREAAEAAREHLRTDLALLIRRS